MTQFLDLEDTRFLIQENDAAIARIDAKALDRKLTPSELAWRQSFMTRRTSLRNILARKEKEAKAARLGK